MFKCELLSGHGTKVVSVLAVLHMPENLCTLWLLTPISIMITRGSHTSKLTVVAMCCLAILHEICSMLQFQVPS
jgi:hypothetical protein